VKKEDEEIAAEMEELGDLLRARLHEHDHDQGLRERKKNLTRQLISDTATRMFFERGFDEVRVSEVAAACNVSEKTVYNYFPTKESLLLDREESSAIEIELAFGPNSVHLSPVHAALAILDRDLNEFVAYLNEAPDADGREILRFNDLIQSTPSLRAAQSDMFDRLAQVAATALATRAGVDPNDPEPQIAAHTLLGLWRVYYRAILRHSSDDLTFEEIRVEVLAEVQRAARLVDTGLWSFATVVQGARGREQFKAATEASNQARKQVLVAIKEAREAWQSLKLDVEARSREGSAAKRQAHHDARTEVHEFKRQIQKTKQEIKTEVKKAVREVRKSGRPKA
jgi:AcrR family transcriptional regulator